MANTCRVSTIRGIATVPPRPRAQAERRPSSAHPRAGRRAIRHSHQLRRRQQNLVFALLAATWIPGVLGATFDVSSLRTWGSASGYLGLSWALPSLVVGLMVDRSARARGFRAHRVVGVVAAAASIALLLVAAAKLMGT